jgi:hypothetical protein
LSKNATQPYILEVLQRPDGFFEWAIRERVRLVERSDRMHPTENLAREKGEAALEGVFAAANRQDRHRK